MEYSQLRKFLVKKRRGTNKPFREKKHKSLEFLAKMMNEFPVVEDHFLEGNCEEPA